MRRTPSRTRKSWSLWRVIEAGTAQQQPAVQQLFGEQIAELLTEDMAVHHGALLSPPA